MIKAATGQVILASLFWLLVLFRPPIAVAEWDTWEYGDAFQDHKRTLAVTQNIGGSALVLKCDSYMGEVYLSFLLEEYIQSKESKTARVRFDKTDIFQINGWVDGKDFSVFGKVDLMRLLPGLRRHQTLAIEVFDYDNDRIVDTFNLVGYSLAEEKVRSTCNFHDN